MFRATKNRIPSVQGGLVKDPDSAKVVSIAGGLATRRELPKLTLVSPELAEPVDLLHSCLGGHGRRRVLLDLPETVVVRQTVEERRVRVTGVDTEGEHGTGFPSAVRMHEMHLGLASVPSDRVICRGVNVPPGHVDRLVRTILLKGETGQGGVHAGLVRERHGRSVTPVEKGTVGTVTIVERGDVRQG